MSTISLRPNTLKIDRGDLQQREDAEVMFTGLINLMLAHRIAQSEGANVAARIRKAARRLRDQTKDPKLHTMCVELSKTTDRGAIRCVERLHVKLGGYL